MSKIIVEMERACLQECDELRTELAEAAAEIAALRAALDQECRKWAALEWRAESLGVQHHGFWFAYVPNKHGDIEKDIDALLSGRGEVSDE